MYEEDALREHHQDFFFHGRGKGAYICIQTHVEVVFRLLYSYHSRIFEVSDLFFSNCIFVWIFGIFRFFQLWIFFNKWEGVLGFASFLSMTILHSRIFILVSKFRITFNVSRAYYRDKILGFVTSLYKTWWIELLTLVL